MTETSSASMPNSPDTINVLPVLSEAKAPVSLTLTIDKSVGKVAGWLLGCVIAALVAASVLSSLAIAFALNARDQAIKAETEFRLVDDWMQQHGVRKVNGRYQVTEKSSE